MCCNCIQNSSKHKAGKSLPLAPHFSPFTVKRKICNKFRIQIDEDLGFWGFVPGLSSYICNAVWARAAVMKIDWNWFRVLASSIFSSFCPQLWHWRCRKQLQHETFLWKLFQTINFIPLCPPNVQGESPHHGIMGRRFPAGGLLRYRKWVPQQLGDVIVVANSPPIGLMRCKLTNHHLGIVLDVRAWS